MVALAEDDSLPAPVIEKTRRRRGFFKRTFTLRVRLAILITMLALSAAVLFIPGGPRMLRNGVYSLLPTDPFELTLKGTPFEMGEEHGKARSFAIKLLCDIYLKRIVCRNNEPLMKKRSAAAARLFSKINPRWTEEVSGISKTSTVPQEVLMLANSFLDLGFDRFGCRQVVLSKKNDDGKVSLLHSHNLDWNNLGGVGNFLVTIFRTERRTNHFATVHIGFPGMVGSLTIINEKGVSLGFNQCGFSDGKSKMPVFIRMREIAETRASFAKAREAILAMPEGMPFFIVLADAKTGEASVFERKAEKVTERPITAGVVAADNTSWHGSPESSCPAEAVARRISKNKDSQLSAMQSTLRDSKVLMGWNIYSVIFDFSDNAFYLASGKIPAAKGKYRKFTLFDDTALFEPNAK